MKRNKATAVLLSALFAALALSGCETVQTTEAGRRFTQRPGEFRESAPAILVDQFGVEGIVEYVPPESLIETYGRGYTNPFVAPMALVTPIEFMVFRATFTALDPGTVIDVRRTEFRFAGRIETPMPANTLVRFWENHESNNDLRAFEKSRRENLIRAELLGHDVRAGDEPVTGLLVFMGRFADYGTGELRFPLVDGNNRVVQEVILEMEFE